MLMTWPRGSRRWGRIRRRRRHCQVTIGALRVKIRPVCRISVDEGAHARTPGPRDDAPHPGSRASAPGRCQGKAHPLAGARVGHPARKELPSLMTPLRCHHLLLAVHCGRLSRPLARQTGLRPAAPAGVCPGRSAGRMPGRCPGSPDLPGAPADLDRARCAGQRRNIPLEVIRD